MYWIQATFEGFNLRMVNATFEYFYFTIYGNTLAKYYMCSPSTLHVYCVNYKYSFFIKKFTTRVTN